MDLKNLSGKYSTLLTHMRQNSYSESYVCKTEQMIWQILSFNGNPDIQSYTDIYLVFIKKNCTDSTLKTYRASLGIIKNFDEHGIYPNRINRQTVWQTSNYHTLIPCFRKLVDEYRNEAGGAGKKETTIQGEARNASSFLAFMQKKGAMSLAKINQRMAVSYFTDENGYPNKSYGLKKQISSVFKSCSLLYTNGECERILPLFKMKATRRRRRNGRRMTALLTFVVWRPSRCKDNIQTIYDEMTVIMVHISNGLDFILVRITPERINSLIFV